MFTRFARPVPVLLALAGLLLPRPAPATVTGAWVADGAEVNANYGKIVGTAGDVNGDGYDDAFLGASGGGGGLGQLTVFHGSAAGIGAVPDWTLTGTVPDGIGSQASTAGDVNGDGYDDLLVGQLLYTDGETFEGRVSLYLGGSDGLAAAPVWQMESNSTGARFGIPAAAGDFNADGFADFLVGAPGWSNNRGKAWLFGGDPSGIPQEILFLEGAHGAELGTTFAAGDMNGDGFDDVLIGAPGAPYVHFILGYDQVPSTVGIVSSPNPGNTRFGAGLTSAGDVNLDGYCDFVVGAPQDSIGTGWQEGVLYLYRGLPGTTVPSIPAWSFGSNVAGAQLGYPVNCAGDVNGDGHPDLAAGAYPLTNGQSFEGRGYLFYGNATSYDDIELAWVAEGEQAFAHFAESIASPGDVNGDGFSDLIVGAPGFDNPLSDQGRAAIWHGGADGPAFQGARTEFDQEVAEYGSAMTLGDFDGDGYDEYVVSTGLFDIGAAEDAGRVWVFPGGPGLASTIASHVLDLGVAADRFGADVSNTHDVDGDGYDDLLVGSPGANSGRGAVHLYRGSASGPGAAPDWSWIATDAGDLGHSVAWAGDVNADGYADAIVGAPYFTDSVASEGAAYVFLGGPTGFGATPAWSTTGFAPGALFGWDVCAVGDVNRDGFGDIAIGAPGFPNGGGSVGGQVFVFFGDAEGISGAEPWIGGEVLGTSETGFSIAGGDFNGDGISDLLVGSPGWDQTQQNQGRVAVHLGNGFQLDDDPAWTYLGAQPDGRLGHAVAAADFDLEGLDEAVVSQPFVWNGQTEEGQVLIFKPVTDVLMWGADGNAPLAWHGRAIASRGDVNGDGFPDLVSGAPGLENPHVHEGVAWLWLGNGGYLYRFFDVLPGMDRRIRLRPADDSQALGLLAGTDMSAILVKAHGRSPLGRDHVALEVEVKPAGTPFDGAGTMTTTFQDTGAPGPAGSMVELARDFAGLGSDTAYRWRARILSAAPLAKRSPWFSDPGNNVHETDFRISGGDVAVVEAGPVGPAARGVLSFASHPVPFAESTTVEFELARPGEVRLAVYDVAGRRLATLAEGRREAGLQRVRWDGTDARGHRVASGVYFAVVDALGDRLARRLVIAR